MTCRLAATALVFLLAQQAWAQPRGEQLVTEVPPGYKAEPERRDGDVVTREMLPEGESLKQWTHKFSTHTFLGMTGMSPDEFREAMRQKWAEACKESSAAVVAGGNENGYPFAVWTLRCPHNASTGKPEIAWFKAVAGKHNFYLVQKVFTSEPTDQQGTRWMRVLRRTEVCDTRGTEHPCPSQ